MSLRLTFLAKGQTAYLGRQEGLSGAEEEHSAARAAAANYSPAPHLTPVSCSGLKPILFPHTGGWEPAESNPHLLILRRRTFYQR